MLPKLWKGNTAFLLGGGPSLSSLDLNLIEQRRVIAVNNAYGVPIKNDNGKTIKYEPRQWVDALWFGDSRWLEWHLKYLERYSGLIAHCAGSHHRKRNLAFYERSKKQCGLDPNPSLVCWNRSSGASAIKFAFHLGVSRVVLLGYDMRTIDEQKNWHSDHKGGPARGDDPYQRFLLAFPHIKKDDEQFGLEIINCTPGIAITEFPVMTLEEYLTNESSLC